MTEQFDKLIKKARLGAIVNSVLAGVATALVCVDAVLLPCLLCSVKLLWAWYVLIALAGFAAGGGVAFLCLRVDGEKFAKKLDKELGLDERVYTAHAYRDDDGDMSLLQRDDAAAALQNAHTKKLGLFNLALTVVLAAVIAVGVIATPVIAVFADWSDAGATATRPVDPPRQVTDWEWQALDDLIEYVRSSTLVTDDAKTGMVTALENLRSVLKSGVSQSGLAVFVRNAITEIRNAVNDANNAAGVNELDRENNSAEEQYVITRLNEIFGLEQGGDDTPDGPNDDDNNEQPISPGNNTGTGDLIINGVPFFDPELGYVSSGDVATRDKYYNIIRQAMLEGTISRSEWEYIVATYFADLQGQDETR